MNKVVCDLCGTSYPENAAQCPICGTARSSESVVVAAESEENSGYTYVKGGRFSKSNVKKRNQGIPLESEEPATEGSGKKFAGLLIVLITLVVIIAFMITMIAITWNKQNNSDPTSDSTLMPCVDITLSQDSVVLTAVDEVWLLDVSVAPTGCTDPIVYYSKNPSIATVSDSGKITCVAEGETVIIVECGSVSARCTVVCQFPEEETLPTVAPTGIHLNRMSITADFEGFSWQLYSGEIPVDQIVWSSDDPSIATFENGVVVAVSEGTTMIHADYNGIRTSCEIICNFQIPESTENPEVEIPTDTEYTLYTMYNTKPKYSEHLKAYDVTISMKEGYVALYLKDSMGNRVDLTWTIVEGTSCTVNGTYVKVNTSASNCMLKAEYNGTTYFCYIRTVN